MTSGQRDVLLLSFVATGFGYLACAAFMLALEVGRYDTYFELYRTLVTFGVVFAVAAVVVGVWALRKLWRWGYAPAGRDAAHHRDSEAQRRNGET